MGDSNKTKAELIQELDALRKKLASMEEELERAHFFELLIENIPHAVFSKDMDGRFTYGNPSYCRLHEVTLDELIGKNDFDMHPPDAANKYRRDDKKILKSLQPTKIDEKNIPLNSPPFYTSVVKLPIVDRDANVRGIMGVFWDTTEQKEMEMALRESEAIYRSVVENIKDVYYRTDSQNTLTIVSPSFKAMLGYTHESEVLGRDVAEFYLDPAKRDELVKELSLKESVKDYEITLLAKDGTPILVSTSSSFYRDQEGNILGTEGVFRDITERKESEEAVRRSEARLRQILEQSPLPIAIVSLNGEIQYLNSRFSTVFGYSRNEIKTLGDWWRLTVPNEKERNTLSKRVERFLNDQDPGPWLRESQYIFTAKSGKALHVQATSSMVDEGMVVMMSDITRLKEAEAELLRSRENLELTVHKRTRELLEANARLQELDKLKSAFLSSVSHELRTPLTSILGFAGIISRDADKVANHCIRKGMDGVELTKRIKEDSRIILEESKRLTRLINDLLDLSKIESGRMEWDDKRLDMADLARESVKAMQGQFVVNPDVELVANIPETGPEIMADPDRIKQVFFNLLHNASKFTRKGRVIITIRSIGNAWAEAVVEDTGPGIAAEDIRLIMESYYQAQNPESPIKGTGLGLSICRQIIERYKGKFWVESEPGRGSSFTIRLPQVR